MEKNPGGGKSSLMAKLVGGDPREDTLQTTQEVSEIDALVESMDDVFVSDNLRELIEAGASIDMIRGKLSTEKLLDRASELMSYGVTQDQILAGIDGLDVLHYKEKVIAAGIVLDPEEVLAAIRAWQEQSDGYAPHGAVTTNLDFVLALGVPAEDMLEVIKKDTGNPAVLLLQSAKRLKQAGADISANDIEQAVETVWNSCRHERIIFENLSDLLEMGANIDVEHFVGDLLQDREMAFTIFNNAPQIIAAGVELDLNDLMGRLRGGHTAVRLLDFLLPRPEVNLETVLQHLTAEDFEKNLGKLVSAFRARGMSIDPVVKRLQGSQLTRRIDYLLEAGASRELILKGTNSHWLLNDAELLISRGFTATEIANQLSGREKIEKLAKLKQLGAEVDLDKAVVDMLDQIDEYYLRSFPNAYEKVAEFLMEHLHTLHSEGANILKIKNHEKLRDIVAGLTQKTNASLFALAQIRAAKK